MADPFETWFLAYARDFDAFDAEAIAARFHCPCLMVGSHGVVPLTTREAILANMRAIMAHHREQRVGHAAVADLRVDPQAETLAIAHVRWKVLDVDGAPLWDWWTSYNLADLGQGWRVLVATTHAEEERPA